MHKPNLLLITLLLINCSSSFAQKAKNDSIEKQDSNIFLNAESDSKPRQVSLGLPTTSTSAVQIFEDGMPVGYYIYHIYPFKCWHGGASAQTTASMGPFEASLRYGEINSFVDSHNRVGSDKFRGSVQYTYGTWGQQKFDLNISAPISHGWGYSLSTYQNFDPGSNHTVTPKLKDRHQFYKGAISKAFDNGRGSMSLVYQYVDYITYQENYGPFIFVGDGSVKEVDGFSLGVDSYRPEITSYQYMDFKTGEIRTLNFDDGNRDKINTATYNLDYDLGNGVHLDFHSRFKDGRSLRGSGSLAGIRQVTAANGYTTLDGTPYSGDVQVRSIMHFDAFETSWMNNAELQFTRGSHALRTGLDYHQTHGGTISSTVAYSHDVKADPEMLLYNGAEYYNYNTGGEYYNGYEHKAAAYIKDDWQMAKHTSLAGFIRLEYLGINGHSANNVGDDTSNTRYAGFNLTKGKITTFRENYLNGSVGLDFNTRLIGGLSLKAQGIFTRVHNTIFDYGGYYVPNTKPTDTRFFQGGFGYVNKWINVVSQLVYISRSNYNTRSVFQHTLQHESAGYPAGFVESVTLPLTYGIKSLGWTTDAQFTPGHGFNLHVQFTMRNPKYEDFEFSPTFSDGVTEHYDFSGKNVTALHKVELTLDPSYTYKDWRFWISARYISKQYINKTNSLFFKERIETFGGIDFQLNKACKFTVNVINMLNQKGASGLISSADLVEDASAYKNYLMSGTFIRPFTVEFSAKIDF